MQFFANLGSLVEERWKEKNYDEDSFPEIAFQALVEKNPSENVDPWDIIRWCHTTHEWPSQHDVDGKFGNPPLTLFAGPRFLVDVYYWVDGTTSIHQHSFSGAFHVLQGSSIHSQYRFENEQKIPTQVERLLVPVPEYEGKHANEPTEGVVESPAFDGPKHDCRVRVTAIRSRGGLASPLQLLPKSREIVQLAVEHNRVPAVFRDHRLMAVGGQIDDGQAPEPESNAVSGIAPNTLVIRTAMYERLCHSPSYRSQPLCTAFSHQIDETRKAAHSEFPFPRRFPSQLSRVRRPTLVS